VTKCQEWSTANEPRYQAQIGSTSTHSTNRPIEILVKQTCSQELA
jgi:hypothetical protein